MTHVLLCKLFFASYVRHHHPSAVIQTLGGLYALLSGGKVTGTCQELSCPQ